MNNNQAYELLYQLKLSRMIEEKMLILLRQGKISKWFSGIGQEAISIGSTMSLRLDDMIFPMHRNLGVFTSRNIDLKKLFCQLMGRDGGFTKGRDRTFHFGLKKINIVGMISHLAAMLPVANGVGLAYKLNDQDKIALAFIGDGATSEGDFHEALNLAAVWSLPVIFLIENNGYGLSTPSSEQFVCKKLIDKALGYGIKGYQVDGNNVFKIYDLMKKIAKDVRNGDGPVLVEANTFRIRGHEESSGVKYVPKSLIAKWKKKDPIELCLKELVSKKIINDKKLLDIENEINDKINEAVDFALNSSFPKSNIVSELNDVYSKSNYKMLPPSITTSKMRFIDAITSAMDLKLESDKKVLIMGQDIAEYGGVFKATDGFYKKFGKDRVRNTPIIESGILGASLGLSLVGFKPIVEMQFSDFVSCGFNQLVNNIAKTHYRWNEPVNITLRMPCGGGIGAGPFHSQSNEAWFLNVPGLKVLYPSNPIDAKGLLISAIEDPNPVVFFEHKALYRSSEADVPNGIYHSPIGKAQLKITGNDLTIVTFGLGVKWIMDIKNDLLNEGYSIDLIDLVSLAPWDKDLVSSSVKKTNKLMIVHESNMTCGVGSEVSAYVTEHCFESLDAPIKRVTSIDTPIPFSSDIENDVYFPVNRLKKEIIEIINY